jgi:ACS family hexuronate transporter-like MFS transporter
VGFLLEKTGGNYIPLFVIAGLAYLFALVVVHLLNPQHKPAKFILEG